MQNACVVWVTEMTTDDTKAIGQALYSGMFSGVAAFVGGMIGYAVQNIGVVPGLNSEEMINVEIERSILLLQITAWVSIFAFVLFVVKYAWIDRRQIKQKD